MENCATYMYAMKVSRQVEQFLSTIKFQKAAVKKWCQMVCVFHILKQVSWNNVDLSQNAYDIAPKHQSCHRMKDATLYTGMPRVVPFTHQVSPHDGGPAKMCLCISI